MSDSEPIPPVTPAEQLLPFLNAGVATNFQWFQRVCADILRFNEDFAGVEQVGVDGEAQEGLDIRATHRPTSEPWGFQCKQEAQFGPEKVTEAIEEVPANPIHSATQYRIMLAREATDKARTRARASGNWDILDRADLSRMVRDLKRDDAIKVILTHFGPFWLERFLGVPAQSSFVTAERYFQPYLNAALLLNLGRPLHGREKALQSLADWCDGVQRALLIEGRLGIGKSKVLYEYAVKRDEAIAMPLLGREIDNAALNDIRIGAVLIIVDDADNRDLAALFTLLARDPDKRAILACKPSSARAILDSLITAGISTPDIAQVTLEGLSREDTLLIARDAAPCLSEDLLEQIALTAGDTPLATIATARLFAATSEGEAVAIFDEVVAQHRAVIQGRIDPGLPPNDVQLALRLVAALGPIRQDSTLLAHVATRFGLPEGEMQRLIPALTAAGVFAVQGHEIAVSPSVVRDGVLIDASTSGASVAPFVHDLYELVGFDSNLLFNLASASDAAKVIGRVDFFEQIWQRAISDVTEMDYARRLMFVKSIRKIWLFKPADIILTLRRLYRNPPNDDTQEFAAFARIRPEHVAEAMPPVLGDILARFPEYSRASVDLLWELAESDPRPLHSNPDAPMRVLSDAAGYGRSTQSAQVTLVEAVAELLKRDDLNEQLHSPLDILEPVIDREVDSVRTRGDMMQFVQASVRVELFVNVRDRALSLFRESLVGGSDRRAIRAVRIVGKLLAGVSVLGAEGASAERLSEERNAVLDMFAEVVSCGSPLRRAVLRDELVKNDHWTGAFGERIRSLISTISIDEDIALYRSVAPEIARQWRIGPAGPEASLLEHEAEVNTERSRVAARMLEAKPTALELMRRLESVAQQVALAGLTPWLLPVIANIATTDIDLAIELALLALEHEEAAHVRPSIAPILYEAFGRRPEEAAKMVKAALAASEEGRIAVANATNAPIESTDTQSKEVQDRFKIISQILMDPQPSVRAAGRLSAAGFVKRFPSLAADLVDAAAGGDGDLVDWIYAELPRDEEGTSLLDATSYERLARHLEAVNDLQWHELEFLGAGLKHHSPAVLRTLAVRLSHPRQNTFRALPHDPSLDNLARAIVVQGQLSAALHLTISACETNADSEYDASELFGRLYSRASASTRATIMELISLGEQPTLEALAGLLSSVPEELLFDDSGLLTAIIERAYTSGVGAGNRVGDLLMGSLLHRAQIRTGRQMSPTMMRLKAAMERALTDAAPASESQAFFRKILADSERELKRAARDDLKTFGPE